MATHIPRDTGDADPARRHAPDIDLDAALRLIAEGTAAATGEAFFRALVRSLAEALGMERCFVAELTGRGRTVRQLARWVRGEHTATKEFDVSDTPCREVLAGDFTFYPEKVCERYPREQGIQSYLGMPLRDASGTVLGHLALLDPRPFAIDTRSIQILEIFAARAAAELGRKRAGEALAESERRLASVLGSAMDAIVTIDGERRITLFNDAAERMFGVPRETALGENFERFMSPDLHGFFRHYLGENEGASGERRQFWAPTGLSAVRDDGTEFPIELTLSPLELSGGTLFTLIVRDLNERRQAEAALHKLRKMKRERSYLLDAVGAAQGHGEVRGRSAVMRRVMEQVAQVAGTDATVLITGETGTGKELIARAIHRQSRRHDRLLVTLNCAALPRELVESELFGHEKGAFTGATQQKRGRFELAHHGTLFLDEVGELPLEAQAKLLRVLQERVLERVGGTEPKSVDVRVIAATNRKLLAEVEGGGFRADLYYRINVFPIELPPLRARRDDIPVLAEQFLADLSASLGKPVERLAPGSLERLLAYPWPGNVRELRNLLERAAILARGPEVDVAGLLVQPEAGAAADDSLESVERSHLVRVLERAGWVIEGPAGAAASLGLHPNTLRSRLKKLGIRRPGA